MQNKPKELIPILQKLQKRKEEAVIKINQYVLPTYMVYLALKKKRLTSMDYKFLLMIGSTNLVLNWTRYRETLRRLLSDQKNQELS